MTGHIGQSITIAILGGTGQEGGGLALRFAKAGHRVVLGSRSAARAAERAAEMNARLGREAVSGADNKAAAAAADTVIITVPYAAQRATVEEVRDALTGKILIDATVPLMPPKVSRVQLPAGGSAVAAIQALLGDAVRVVSAFQNVSAHHLNDLDHDVDCDVLVCGDDAAARETVIGLAAAIGLTAWHAGPLVNSAAAEALTSVMIFINRHYKSPGSGIRITGVPPPPPLAT
jgi:8-hydroxy-5-deazaflavin:NADPH oxidoreductase